MPGERRSIEERLALAAPRSLIGLVPTGVTRLPPGSAVRRRVLKRAFARGLEGPGRNDLEASLLVYEPDVEVRVFGEVPRALGLPANYHGHQGVLDAWSDYKEDMGEFQYDIEEIVDL